MKKALLIMGLLGMMSCGIGNEYFEAYTKSYVIEYYSFSGIEASWKYEKGYILLEVTPNGKTYGVLSTTDTDKAKYEAKCALHGDNTYNRIFYYGPNHTITEYQDRDFTGMEITSGQDYDETHPAGTSLNDLFYFASSSPIKYIARGYENAYDWDNHPPHPEHLINYLRHVSLYRGNEPVYGIAADMEAADLVLLGGTQRWYIRALAALTPVTEPTLDRTHDITITLTDTDGNELTAHVVISF